MPYTPSIPRITVSPATNTPPTPQNHPSPNGMVRSEPHIPYQVHGLLPAVDIIPNTPPRSVVEPPASSELQPVFRRHIRTHSEGIRPLLYGDSPIENRAGAHVNGYAGSDGFVMTYPARWRRDGRAHSAQVDQDLVRPIYERPQMVYEEPAPRFPVHDSTRPRTYTMPPRPAPDSEPDLERVFLPASIPMGTSRSLPYYLEQELMYPLEYPTRHDPTRFPSLREQLFPTHWGPFFVDSDEPPARAASGVVAPASGFTSPHANINNRIPGLALSASLTPPAGPLPAPFASVPPPRNPILVPPTSSHGPTLPLGTVPLVIPQPHPGMFAHPVAPRGMPAPAPAPAPAPHSQPVFPWYHNPIVVQQLMADNGAYREEIDELRQRVVDMTTYLDEVRANMEVMHTNMSDIRVEMFGGRERAFQAAHAAAMAAQHGAAAGPAPAAHPPMPPRLPTADVPEMGPQDELTRLMRHTAVNGANLSRVMRERARLSEPHEWAEALELVADGEAGWARMWRRMHQLNQTSRAERSILYALTGNQAHIVNMDLEDGAVMPGRRPGDNVTVVGEGSEVGDYGDEDMDFDGGEGEMLYDESDDGFFEEDEYDWGDHKQFSVPLGLRIPARRLCPCENIPFDIRTTAEEAAVAFKDQIAGKNIVIVGATVSSLGAEFLRVVAPHAGTIWIAGRSPERLQIAIDAAVGGLASPKPDIRKIQMDMLSFESVRAGASEIDASELPIHVVVQNVMIPPEGASHTVDGFESQLQGSHLSTFLLYSLLLPRLRQAEGGARLVTISSIAHTLGPFRWDDPNYKLRPEEYDGIVAYQQAKLANVLFTRELAKQAASEDILAFTMHPGNILTTGGSKAIPIFIQYNSPMPIKSIQTAVATYVVAAFDPALADKSGAYLEDCQVRNDKVAPAVTDADGVRLSSMTEDMLGLKFL